ncbi:MATE family efflux transporter [Bauldia sp.]|uniref:MATE family efflux transporter n=1 Tax=Bauldia sp. TaxID=2575872 RepID=UPI003BAD7174
MVDIAGKSTAMRGAWAAEARATLALAWPLVITNLSQGALGFTDTIMMGWIGPRALGAGVLAVNLYFAFLIFAIGVVTATSPMIAIELGRRKHSVRDVRRTVRQGWWAAITITIPIWIVLWNAEALFLLLGQDPELAAEAARYMATLKWSILPFLGYIVLRNFVSALERPRAAMWIGITAVAVNAAFVYVFMFGRFGMPELGLAGAGIGTVIANLYMFLGMAAIVSFDRRFRRYALFGRFWRADWARYRDLWKLGLPIGVTLAFEVTIFNASAFLMGLIGPAPLAAHAIAIQVASIAFMVPLGLAMASTVRVGRAYGAGNIAGIGRAGWTAFAMAMTFAACTSAVMLLAGRPIVGLFLALDDPANQAVIGIAVTLLILAGLFQFADAGQAVAAGMLRGLGDTRIPMIYAGIGYWGVGIGLGVILGFLTPLAGAGIWIGLTVGLSAVAIPLTWRWARRDRIGLTTKPPPDARG